MTFSKKLAPALGIAAWFLAMPPGLVQAAPQALALLETGGAIPLDCAGGVCQAEFSTFCLQEKRDLPDAHTSYHAAATADLHLVLTDEQGATRQIPAAAHVRILTPRAGHTAVVIELPQSRLAALGGAHAAIAVGQQVTLLPAEVAGDADPLTDAEIQAAQGPLRSFGASIVDRSPQAVETVHALTRLVNTLPERNAIGPNAPEQWWRDTAGRRLETAPAATLATARQEYDSCWRQKVVSLGGMSVRNCLQRRHDDLMWDNVKAYWNAAGTGS